MDINKALLLLTLSVLLVSCEEEIKEDRGLITSCIVYGDDNRQDVAGHPCSAVKELSSPVAVMVFNHQLRDHPQDKSLYKYSKTPAFAPFDLCSDDAFTTQNTLSHCTGFLIADDILVTAGHCVDNNNMCSSVSWVFDYIDDNGTLQKTNVFECTEVLSTGVNEEYYNDYTVIRLAQKVLDREPLNFNSSDELEVGTPLVLIGSPFGIPLKIADDASVIQTQAAVEDIFFPALDASQQDQILPLNKSSYFMANIDSFAGNSGSPVINAKTGLVEGIVSYGGEDWFYDEESFCNRTRVKKQKENVEEMIFKMSHIPYFKN